MPFLLILLLVFYALTPASAVAQWDSATTTLLTNGDTGTALAQLRQRAQTTDTPENWCALAELLTATATSHQSSWRVRFEASEAFDRGLRGGDIQCLYSYALLKEKQGTRVDEQRMLGRVEKALVSNGTDATPAFRAELLYRRALLMDDWLRNYDYLVKFPGILPIHTPDCAEVSPHFCENFARPRQFNEQFVHAPKLASLVADDRRTVVRLLDSALSLDPLLADAETLVGKLAGADIPHEFVVYEDMPHGFVQMEEVFDDARRAIDAMVAFLA